jgi:threonylcarbamoyladenosine tRNA methylthiotransferase MtaB
VVSEARAAGVVTTRPIRTAAITNLGCKVNQSEMEAAARLLRARGIRVVDDGPADLHLVNTCTVTVTADQKSRQAVRQARRANPGAAVVVTGCSVQVDAAARAAADPEATLVDNASKSALLAELAMLTGPHGTDPGGGAMPTLSGVELEGVADDRASVERTRAFVKVQDGCSFYCTYCIIPRARGPERSLSPDDVIADVRRALAQGHREIVLTGINIGTYDGGWSERGFRGSHTRSTLTLAGLIGRLLDETGVERLRLSSIEPQHVDDELLAVWQRSGGRCLLHFHLPLQSGDDGVLRRMGRRYRSEEYAAVVRRVRDAVPEAAIHADVIVGFPTEDDAAWRRSVDFIDRLGLAGLHVFRYSARPGTPAERMAGQVAESARKARAAELLALAARARARWAAGRVGGSASVLVEGERAAGQWVGHAEDGTMVAIPGAGLENAIVTARLTAVDAAAPDRLLGRATAISPAPRPMRAALPLAPSMEEIAHVS